MTHDEVKWWTGTFSWKGMIHEILLAGLASLALVLWGPFLIGGPHGAPLSWFLAGLVWLVLVTALLIRKLRVRYTLTNHRLVHRHGILHRVTHRIETIDLDDISLEQNLLEQLVGVGRIRIASSDVTHPHITLSGIDRADRVAHMMDEARRQERQRRGLYVESM